MPALELTDPPDLRQDVETILAGNIFHRAVAFGPRAETGSPGAARILVNGEQQHEIPAQEAGARLEEMVEVVAGAPGGRRGAARGRAAHHHRRARPTPRGASPATWCASRSTVSAAWSCASS